MADNTSQTILAWFRGLVGDLDGRKGISLRFEDKDREKRFLRQHLMSSLIIIRLFVIFWTILYVGYGISDSFIADVSNAYLWSWRVAVSVVNICIILPLTYRAFFFRHSQAILGSCLLFSGIGILAQISVIPAPLHQLYCAGLIVAIIYCSTLIRLHCLTALAISVTLVGAYQFVAIWANPIHVSMLLVNDFFLLTSVLMGGFSSFFQEVFIRRNFVNLELLAAGKARAEKLQETAEAANRAKSEFLAIMSHELRTPLNAIIGFSDIMKSEIFGPLNNARYTSYVADISESGNHLLEIINVILDLSKAEAGKLVLEEKEVELWRLTESCIKIFREMAAAAEVRIALIAPRDPVMVRADERLCKQIIFNLISNAVKFTKPGGEIAVSCFADPFGGHSISVQDNGIGIAEQDITRVLEPFVQVENSHTRQYSGTGMGLPLVKKIIELHGGVLTLQSCLGRGTTASIYFPPERSLPDRSTDERFASVMAAPMPRKKPVKLTLVKAS